MDGNPDVAIIGAGAIGLTAAYELLRAGARVAVYDRGEPGRAASWAGAGIIPPGNPAGAVAADDRLRAESAARWPALAAELTELTGLPTGYRVCGGYEHAADSNAAWRAEGIRFHFDDDANAYFFPDMAQVRNPWLLRALASAVGRLGGVVRGGVAVRDWRRVGETRAEAVTDQGPLPAGEYLVCGGAWTDELLSPLGVRPGVVPVRGQMLLYRLPVGGPEHIHVWDKKYLVPRGDGLILAGSTEEKAGFEAAVTEAGRAELRRFAEGHWPPLATGVIEASWAGLRPGTADHRPYLGRLPGWANVSVAAGHFRAGIQLAPATARVMAELLTGRAPSLPLDSFRPDRPPGRPARPAFRS